MKHTDETLTKIAELRCSGYGYKRIGTMLGLKRDTVRGICRRTGYVGYCDNPAEYRREKKKEYVPKAPHEMICKNCGKQFMAKGNTKYCSDECRKAAAKEASHKRRQGKHYESKAVHMRYLCQYCGADFISTSAHNTKFCSQKCRHRYHDVNKKHRDRRLTREQIKDVDISIQALIIRDDNTCHLCGGKCDLYDYWFDDRKKIVCGDNYPSIDHLVPLAKGGEHSWENVRLAHRRCNSLKGAKLI